MFVFLLYEWEEKTNIYTMVPNKHMYGVIFFKVYGRVGKIGKICSKKNGLVKGG